VLALRWSKVLASLPGMKEDANLVLGLSVAGRRRMAVFSSVGGRRTLTTALSTRKGGLDPLIIGALAQVLSLLYFTLIRV
jgi:hypothetical protein